MRAGQTYIHTPVDPSNPAAVVAGLTKWTKRVDRLVKNKG
jgi:hypothetical protein